jgi:hypothetical protein
MKTLAVLAAAVTISLTCAGTASAGPYAPYNAPVTETRTSTPRHALCAVVQLITEATRLDVPHWCQSRSFWTTLQN